MKKCLLCLCCILVLFILSSCIDVDRTTENSYNKNQDSDEMIFEEIDEDSIVCFDGLDYYDYTMSSRVGLVIILNKENSLYKIRIKHGSLSFQNEIKECCASAGDKIVWCPSYNANDETHIEDLYDHNILITYMDIIVMNSNDKIICALLMY